MSHCHVYMNKQNIFDIKSYRNIQKYTMLLHENAHAGI